MFCSFYDFLKTKWKFPFLNTDGAVRGAACEALAHMGDAGAIHVEAIADTLEDSSKKARGAACEALADGLAGVRADVRGVGNEVRMGLLPPEPPK